MAQKDFKSQSELSIQKSNLKLLIGGVIFFVLFLIVAVASFSGGEKVEDEVHTIWNPVVENELEQEITEFEQQKTEDQLNLNVSSTNVELRDVKINTSAEGLITLTAKGGPIVLEEISLAEKQEGGFTINGSCSREMVLPADSSCNLRILWTPDKVRQIQNILKIVWRLDDKTAFPRPPAHDVLISLIASSSDEKDCIVCENVTPAPKTSVADQRRRGKSEIELIDPDKIPISIDGIVMGKYIPEKNEVVDFEGNLKGRVLADGTIVNSELVVLGRVLDLLPVIDYRGQVIGELIADGTVVDDKGNVIGFPMADGTVVFNNEIVGSIMPWSVILNLSSQVIGRTERDASVVNRDGQKIGRILPGGIAVNDVGMIIGGVVPQGVAIGHSCQSFGMVQIDGRILNSFDQPMGYVTIDGLVLNNASIPQGRVIRQGLVINTKGETIGYVNNEGKVVDKDKNVLGCLNPDGTVDGVGIVLPQGRVIGYDGVVKGLIMPNGTVSNVSGLRIGYIISTGEVLDLDKRVMGSYIPTGTAISPGCGLLGIIDLNGQVLNTAMESIGYVTPDQEVYNTAKEKIGEVTPIGTAVDLDGKFLGIVRLDGKVVDPSGKVVGCLMPGGFVMDEKGNINGQLAGGGRIVTNKSGENLVIIGDKVYDENGVQVGEIVGDNVLNNQGELIGFIPKDGVVVSDDGIYLGRYSKQVGAVIDGDGVSFGKVLMDNTVVSIKDGKVVGALIPDNSKVINENGNTIGTVDVNGNVIDKDGKDLGIIRANGSLVSKDGQMLGGIMPTGFILNGLEMIGAVLDSGDIQMFVNQVSPKVLLDGTVINSQKEVIGRIYKNDSLLIDNSGAVLGFPALDNRFKLRNGKKGYVDSFGNAYDENKNLIGRSVRVGLVINNSKERIVGSLSFDGGLVKGEREIGHVWANGTVVDADGFQIGHILPRGVVIDADGQYMGQVLVNGELRDKNFEKIGDFPYDDFLLNDNGNKIGRLLPAGVVLDEKGILIGRVGITGIPLNLTGQKIGQVKDNNLVLDDGKVIGQYYAYGTPILDLENKLLGFVSYDGNVRNPSNELMGKVIGQNVVDNQNEIVGTILSPSVALSNKGQILFPVLPNGQIPDKTQVGFNNFVYNQNQESIGFMPIHGYPYLNDTTPFGNLLSEGAVLRDDRQVAKVSMQYLFDASNRQTGFLTQPGIVIDTAGQFMGTFGWNGLTVYPQSKEEYRWQPFGSVLQGKSYRGRILNSGIVVDDTGRVQGLVSSSGTVMDKGNRIGVIKDYNQAYTDKGDWIGEILKVGLPISWDKKVLGRQNPKGQIVGDKKTNYALNTGMVLSDKNLLIGQIVEPNLVLDNNNVVIAVINGNGEAQTNRGEVLGKVSSAGIVQKNHALDIVGTVVQGEVVYNNCQLVGSVSVNGQVMDEKGQVLGSIDPTGKAVSLKGEYMGRVYTPQIVLDAENKIIGQADFQGIIMAEQQLGCLSEQNTLLNNTGEVMGYAHGQGIIISDKGKILGYLKKDGTPVSSSGATLGQLDYTGHILGKDGTVIGTLFDTQKYQLLLSDKDDVQMLLSRNGEMYLPSGGKWLKLKGKDLYAWTGQKIATVADDGRIFDLKDNEIGQVDEVGFVTMPNFLFDKDNNVIGIEKDGLIYDTTTGEKIGEVLPDGTYVINNQKLDNIKQTTPLDIKMPSMMNARSMSIGKQKFYVLSDDTIVDEKGEMKGTMRAGVPYSLSDQLLVDEIIGPDIITPAPTYSPEHAQQVSQAINQKRNVMREGLIMKGNLSRLTPSGKILAKARKKQDRDYGAKIVSGWPVKLEQVVLKGKAIPAVLQSSIDSRFVDGMPISAVVERHIYAEAGRNIIIPAGSRLIGEAEGISGEGRASKIDIKWTRLIRPDGAAFTFEATSGDAQGRGGVAGYLDEQFLDRYGRPALLSATVSAMGYLIAVDDAITTNQDNATTVQSDKAQAAADARAQFLGDMQAIFEDMIQNASGVEPIVFIPSGTRLTVYANEDLFLRSESDDVDEYLSQYGADGTEAQTPDSRFKGQGARPIITDEDLIYAPEVVEETPMPTTTPSVTDEEVVDTGKTIDDIIQNRGQSNDVSKPLERKG